MASGARVGDIRTLTESPLGALGLLPTEGLAALPETLAVACVQEEEEKEARAGGRLLGLAQGPEDVTLTPSLKGGAVTPWAGNRRC